jgi:hypothetical protein
MINATPATAEAVTRPAHFGIFMSGTGTLTGDSDTLLAHAAVNAARP